MQVDPMKPELRPPGSKRLKLYLDILLSTSAFKLNLRRFNKEEQKEKTAVRGTLDVEWNTDWNNGEAALGKYSSLPGPTIRHPGTVRMLKHGREGIESQHSTDVESPPRPSRVWPEHSP